MKAVEIVISDTHIGHKTGLMWPDPDSDYRPQKHNRWLFKCFEKFLLDVDKYLDKWKPDYVHSSWLGDMGDLDFKNRSRGEYWATNVKDITYNAGMLFDPLAQVCDHIHVVRGTESHTGDGSTVDDQIAAEFDNVVPFDEKGNKHAHPLIDLDIAGVHFDYLHKGRNRTKWTRTNGLNSLREEVVQSRHSTKDKVPDVVGRGHFHYFGDTSQNMSPYVMALPSWQLPTRYITHLDPVAETPHVGGVAMVLEDGEILNIEPMIYQMPRGRAWRAK